MLSLSYVKPYKLWCSPEKSSIDMAGGCAVNYLSKLFSVSGSGLNGGAILRAYSCSKFKSANNGCCCKSVIVCSRVSGSRSNKRVSKSFASSEMVIYES